LRVPIYVLNMRGQPLMPTTQRTGKKLLKEGKAKVVERCPFTIQLTYATGELKQEIRLGVDIGYTEIGFSAKTENLEVISGTLVLRKDVFKKLDEKRMYRRGRRNKLWYRKPRFLNRRKEEGWLAPSTQHRLDSHIRLVKKIKTLLPITFTKVEVANFDAHKMQNPEIKGVEYQQGELQGYEVREYLLEKWGRKCAYCGRSNLPLEVEHIIPRSRGGTDSVSNLTLSCEECNRKKNTMTAEEFGYPHIQTQAKKSLKETAVVNNIRWEIVETLGAEHTYGYITKYDRKKLGLEKSHINDAFVIAGGTTQERCCPYKVVQVRRGNRSLQLNRKGVKPAIRRQRYTIQPYDRVRYKNKTYLVKGTHCCGERVIVRNVHGKNKSIAIKDVELVTYGKGLLFSVN
jgi:hypothetical protein